MEKIKNFVNKYNIKIEWLVVIAAICSGIFSYYPTLTNIYIFADDVRICTFWMHQFHDPALFQNDILTELARYYEPWGFNFLYYLATFVFHPIAFGTLLAIFLISVTAYYLYQITKDIGGVYAGILAVTAFLTTPTYISRMAGGFPRTFAYPLIAMFLYYLIKKDYLKVCVTLVLQCLFYPMMFLISASTLAFTFLRFDRGVRFLDTSRVKWKWLLIIIAICAPILISKYIVFQNPNLGTTPVKKDMIGVVDYYRGVGRSAELLPIEPLFQVVERNVVEGSVLSLHSIKYLNKVPWGSVLVKVRIYVALVFLFILAEIFRRKIKVPIEFLYMILVGVILFFVADWLLLKLYVPTRYIRYTYPLLSLIFFSIFYSQLSGRIPQIYVRRGVQAAIILFVLFNYNVNKDTYLLNRTDRKEIYDFINTFPKDALIAAPPRFADDIPLFAKRKVFINYEMSFPFYTEYWKIIRQRTVEYFNAYYHDNPLAIYAFCQKNGIEYLVVDTAQFSAQYLQRGRFYFEPFNTIIKQFISKRHNFVLQNIPEQDKLFVKDNIYIINRDALLKAYKALANNE